MDCRRGVEVRERPQIVHRRAWAGIGHIGAAIDQRAHSHGQEAAVGVEREFRLGHVVAAVIVADEAFAVLTHPLDGPRQQAGGPQHKQILGIGAAAQAEAAADIAHMQHVLGELAAQPVRVMPRGAQRVAVLERVVTTDAGARLQGVRRPGIQPRDPRMRMRRARHIALALVRLRHVVDVDAAAGREPRILGPRNRLADIELTHGTPPAYPNRKKYPSGRKATTCGGR